MKILVLTTSYPATAGDYRGSFVRDLALALADRGHKITVLAPHPGGKARCDEEGGGVAVARVGALPVKSASLFGRFGVVETLKTEPWRLMELPLSLTAYCVRAAWAAGRHDLVVANWLVPCGLIAASLARLPRGKPVVVVEHGGGVRLLAGLPGGARLLSFIARQCTAVQFVAKGQRDTSLDMLEWSDRDCLAGRSFTFPVPVADAPGLRGDAPTRFYFPPLKLLFAGRLVDVKGPLLLLKAFARTRNCVLHMVGDGPLKEEVEDYIAGQYLSDRVTLHGELTRHSLSTLYSQCDVLVVPSEAGRNRLSEGVPRVLMEGMAAGLVPVVAATGGMPDVVRNGFNGLVFTPGSSVELSHALKRLSSMGKKMARMAREGEKTAARYTFSRMFDSWKKFVPKI